MKKLIFTGEIWKEGDMYTSYCPELDLASCGETIEQAKKNLLEVVEIFIEETSKLGTLRELLEEAGYNLDESDVLQQYREPVSFEQMELQMGAI